VVGGGRRLIAGFVLIELRSAHPLLPMRVLAGPDR
jgi:hypothetical protein